MAPVRTCAALITMGAALALLFVVVCPLTPTPVAVVSNHGPQVCSPAAEATLLAGAVSRWLARATPSLLVAGIPRLLPHGQSPHPGHGQLAELTCAWLC